MDPNLLEHVGTVVIPARDVPFVAKENYVVNTADDAKVKIDYIHPNFKKWFLEGGGKVEDVCGEHVLCDDRLRKQASTVAVIAALGGEERFETTLHAAFSFMEKGRNPKCSFRLFLIKDSTGTLRTVHMFWGNGGWGVFARSIDTPDGWFEGFRVFSPQPCSCIL